MDAGSEAIVEAILEEYRSKSALYDRCTNRLRVLLEQLLDAEGLSDRIHSVTCRTKDIEKLREKLSREERHYAELGDVTDLVGLRVITYFADDVDKIATLIESEFDIDPENSVDKRKALDPDRFGYLSRHFVCKLKEERSGLTEYSAFKDMSLEIQVRSILQHAWAEIEHDLGYKSREAIPAPMRRRFSKLAGLLEVADDEFERLRRELEEYASGISAAIERAPAVVLIDKVSLLAYISQDAEVLKWDNALADVWGCSLADDVDVTYVERSVQWLQLAGLTTIEEIQESLKAAGELVVRHVKHDEATVSSEVESPGERPVEVAAHGVSIYRLCIFMLADRGEGSAIRAPFEKIGQDVTAFAERMIATAQDVRASRDEPG